MKMTISEIVKILPMTQQCYFYIGLNKYAKEQEWDIFDGNNFFESCDIDLCSKIIEIGEQKVYEDAKSQNIFNRIKNWIREKRRIK